MWRGCIAFNAYDLFPEDHLRYHRSVPIRLHLNRQSIRFPIQYFRIWMQPVATHRHTDPIQGHRVSAQCQPEITNKRWKRSKRQLTIRLVLMTYTSTSFVISKHWHFRRCCLLVAARRRESPSWMQFHNTNHVLIFRKCFIVKENIWPI